MDDSSCSETSALTWKERDGVLTVQLHAELGIAGAAVLKENLQGLLSDVQPLEINAAAVERVDTAAVQLLLAFAQEVRRRKRSLRWVGVSAPLYQTAEVLGLARSLEWNGPSVYAGRRDDGDDIGGG